MNDRLEILKIWVDPVDMDGALARVRNYLNQGDRPHAVLAVNPEKNFSVPRDPGLYEVFRRADLLIPDGVGVVLAARLLHGVRISRVPGVALMEKICALAAAEGHKIFIYGAKEEVNQKATEELVRRYPGLEVAGRSNGYVKDDGMPELVDQINRSGARVLFLALGSPKQEMWFAAHGPNLDQVRVVQGIGGTLDVVAGNVKRAPEWWQNRGLEWLYRLLSEPKRIGRQKVLPVFGLKVLWAWLTGKFSGKRK